jgi:hypothetical protein
MIRIAFVKYAGLAAGGTERWLQTMAAALPRDRFAVDYYFADAVPHIGSSAVVAGTDPQRLQWMRDQSVNLIEFTLEAVDERSYTKRWINTNFWDLFDPSAYDFVQCAKEGLPEFPFTQMGLPVFEQVSYTAGVDHSPNVVSSGFHSQWHRAWWARRGGPVQRSFVNPIPVASPHSDGDLRGELGIAEGDRVVGLHQRPSDATYSPMPLEALARSQWRDAHVVILGGSTLYGEQARALGLRFHQLEPIGDPDRISRFLNSLDLFIHGRRDGETFGLVLSEALAHGVPCVSHRVRGGGNAQLETIGPGGVVVDDADGYAAAIDRLLGDEALRMRYSKHGIAHVRRRCSLAATVAEQVRQYEAFMEHGTSARSLTIPYGEEPGGLLVAGDVEDASHPAHAVIAGAPARPAVRHLIGSFPFASVLEIGCHRAFVSLVAAASGVTSVQVVRLSDDDCDCCESIRLNGFDDWVHVHDALHDVSLAAPALIGVTREPGATAWLLDHVGHLRTGAVAYLFESEPDTEMRWRLSREGVSEIRLGREWLLASPEVMAALSPRRLVIRSLSEHALVQARTAARRSVEPLLVRMRGPVKAWLHLVRSRSG